MLRLPCKLSRTFMDSSLRPSNLTIERSGYRWTSDRAFDQQLGRSKDLSFKSSRSSQIFFCVVNSWKNFFFLGHEATELKFTGFISSNFDQNAERENTRGWCCWYDSTSSGSIEPSPSPSPSPSPLSTKTQKNQQEKRITSRKIFFSLFLERNQFMFDALISRWNFGQRIVV